MLVSSHLDNFALLSSLLLQLSEGFTAKSPIGILGSNTRQCGKRGVAWKVLLRDYHPQELTSPWRIRAGTATSTLMNPVILPWKGALDGCLSQYRL